MNSKSYQPGQVLFMIMLRTAPVADDNSLTDAIFIDASWEICESPMVSFSHSPIPMNFTSAKYDKYVRILV